MSTFLARYRRMGLSLASLSRVADGNESDDEIETATVTTETSSPPTDELRKLEKRPTRSSTTNTVTEAIKTLEEMGKRGSFKKSFRYEVKTPALSTSYFC